MDQWGVVSVVLSFIHSGLPLCDYRLPPQEYVHNGRPLCLCGGSMAETSDPTGGKRALTVCAYLAVDNGKYLPSLIEEVERDVAEMKAAGATRDMAVCIQIDTGEGNRFVLAETPGAVPEQSLYIGPVNMGDPDTLMAFLDWAMLTRPAEKYALIIGSHGSGPKADPIYEGRNVRSATSAESAQVDAPRAIAFDDTSKSFLSIPDLRRCLEYGVKKAGKPFAVVLMDACYMANYETLYELQGLADYVVASPEAIPGEGMQYTALLMEWGLLKKERDFASDLAEQAVDEYMAHYQYYDEIASLLAVDMAELSPLRRAMDALGTALLGAKCARPMIAASLNGTEVTSDPDFLYLYEWLARLIRDKVPKAVKDAGAAVMRLFWETETQKPLLAAAWARTGVVDDITVYLPSHIPTWYKALKVAETPWGKWVAQYVG
jgi:hypothetical protein